MLENGADISLRNNVQGTAMHFAAANGALESLKILVSANADPNAKDNLGAIPLDMARTEGQNAVVEYLQSLIKSCFLNVVNRVTQYQTPVKIARLTTLYRQI